MNVQIFGLKNSQATRAAERFFKERRVAMQFVDLKQKPMAPAEINRFIQAFGLNAILDTAGKPFEHAGLKYLRVSEPQMLAKIEQEPRLLVLPLIRCGKLLSVGQQEDIWTQMAAL